MVKPLEFPDAPEKKLSSPASDLAPKGYLQNELVMDMRPSQAATNNYELTENLSVRHYCLESTLKTGHVYLSWKTKTVKSSIMSY
jgi:hypothetical protein